MNELEYALHTIAGTPFEKLASDFLRVSDFEVHESGLKGTDGGWDARVEAGDQRGIAHASVQNDWRSKIRKDAKKVHKLEQDLGEDYDLFVFVTNQEVTGVQELELEDELRSEYDWNVQIIHRQNILGELRTNHPELADQHLGVELGPDRDHLEQVSDLRDERLEEIRDRTGIARDLRDGPAVVLHVIPNGVFSNEQKALTGDTPKPPVLWDTVTYRSETRGKALITHFPELGTPWESYGQIRNDGLYETATTTGVREGTDGKYVRLSVAMGSIGLDAATVIAVRRALSALDDLGFSGTASVSISLLEASGARVAEQTQGFRVRGQPTRLQTDTYSTEPVSVTIGSHTVIRDVEPALSEVCRELGKENGTENIEDGEWVGGKVTLNHEVLLEPSEEDE